MSNLNLDVSKDVKWIGVLDHDIVTFDVVMETQYGTSYNSYFINAAQKAIVETSKEKFWPEYETKIRSVCDPAEIRFIILNHTEPDHSGNLFNLLSIAPNAEVIGSGNAIRYLKDMFDAPFLHRIVKDGDSLSLGNKTLEFISAPNLHWPDSMYTWLKEDRILFSCDSFGAHYAGEAMFDELVDKEKFEDAFRYYFDVILKPFSRFMVKAIEKIDHLDIQAICPGHGPILRTDWRRYVDLSLKWSQEYLNTPSPRRVFIPYVSAYDKTGRIARAIAEGVKEAGDIDVEVQDIEMSAIGELEMQLTMASGIIVGSPVINQNILLPVYKLFALISPLRDKGKLAGGFGSYGWSGENRNLIRSSLENLKLKYHGDGAFFKFSPTDEELVLSREYGRTFGEALLEAQIGKG